MVQGISSGGLTYLVISNVLAVLTTIAVTLRLLSRQATRSRNNEPGVRTGIRTDDGICVASLPIYLAMVVQANLWATMGKIGFPTRSLTPDQLESFLEVTRGSTHLRVPADADEGLTDLLCKPDHLFCSLPSGQAFGPALV